MKTSLGILAILLILGGAYGYNANQNSLLNEQQLASYQQQVQSLLTQVEESSLKSLEQEKQIRQLQSDLLSSNSQLTSVANQLQSTQEQVSPDFQRLESRIRQEVSAELQQQSNQRDTTSRLGLIRQLTELDPLELTEVMSLQAQYGGFLQSLNVSDERMEVVVGALSNMIADQNQARMEVMVEMQTLAQNGDGRGRTREMRGQIRTQMSAINSLEAQRESLSYALTDEEMLAFEEFQTGPHSTLNNRTRAFTAAPVGGSGRAGAIFLGGEQQQLDGGRVEIFDWIELDDGTRIDSNN